MRCLYRYQYFSFGHLSARLFTPFTSLLLLSFFYTHDPCRTLDPDTLLCHFPFLVFAFPYSAGSKLVNSSFHLPKAPYGFIRDGVPFPILGGLFSLVFCLERALGCIALSINEVISNNLSVNKYRLTVVKVLDFKHQFLYIM